MHFRRHCYDSIFACFTGCVKCLLQEGDHGAVELPKMLSDSQRMCKVIVELIETERQYVRVSTVYFAVFNCSAVIIFAIAANSSFNECLNEVMYRQSDGIYKLK